MELSNTEHVSLEEKIDKVESWINHLNSECEVLPISPELVKEVLISFGANFDSAFSSSVKLKPGYKGYSTSAKRAGLRAVWGEKYAKFVDWANSYADEYETTTGDVLTVLPIPGKTVDGLVAKTKINGMKQFLNELTEFAMGTKDFNNFKIRLEARVFNGIVNMKGISRDLLLKVDIPNSNTQRPIALVPPGYVKDLFTFLKNN